VLLFTSFPTVFSERLPTLVWEREADGPSWLIGVDDAMSLLTNELEKGVDDISWLIGCAGMASSPWASAMRFNHEGEAGVDGAFWPCAGVTVSVDGEL